MEGWVCFYILFSCLMKGEEECFMLSYFVIVFFSFPFQCRLNDFIKFKSIVGQLSLARFLFQSKFGHHISVCQL